MGYFLVIATHLLATQYNANIVFIKGVAEYLF